MIEFEGRRLVSRATKEVSGLGRGGLREHGCLPSVGTCEAEGRLVLGLEAEFEARTLVVFQRRTLSALVVACRGDVGVLDPGAFPST